MKKIFIATIFCLIGILRVNASSDILYDAEEIPNVYIRKVSSDGTEKVKQGGFIRRKSDNSFVYCVEPFASLKNNYEYTSYTEDYPTHLGISEDTWNKISLIAYYGYQYENHQEDYWYYITQIMIWREIDKNAEFHFTAYLGGPNDSSIFASEIEEIETLVNNHLKLPELTLEDIRYGETKTFEDKNAVLNNYIIDDESAYITDSNLIISGSTLGTNTITLKRVSDNYASVPIVYVDTVGQNVLAVGNIPDIEMTINYNVIENKIKVIKVDEDNNLIPGVTIALYDESGALIDINTTNEQGEIIFNELKLGKYTLKELETLDNYVLDDTPYEIELLSELEEITIVNEYKKGSLEIIKVDPNNNPIPETEFTLINSEEEIAGTYVTNEEGKITVTDLKIGKYFLEETKSNPNYHLLDERIEFNITDNDEVIEITVTNELINVDIPDTLISYNTGIFILPNKKNKFGNI